jgi:hypothetical protein
VLWGFCGPSKVPRANRPSSHGRCIGPARDASGTNPRPRTVTSSPCESRAYRRLGIPTNLVGITVDSCTEYPFCAYQPPMAADARRTLARLARFLADILRTIAAVSSRRPNNRLTCLPAGHNGNAGGLGKWRCARPCTAQRSARFTAGMALMGAQVARLWLGFRQCIGGGIAIGQFVQAGQAGLDHAQPGERFLVARPGHRGARTRRGGPARFEGEALDDERDHDRGGGQHQYQVSLRGSAAPLVVVRGWTGRRPRRQPEIARTGKARATRVATRVAVTASTASHRPASLPTAPRSTLRRYPPVVSVTLSATWCHWMRP